MPRRFSAYYLLFFCYFLSLRPSSFAKNSFVSFTTVPESNNNAIRFGILIGAVKGIGDVPQQVKVDGCAEDCDERINDEERAHGLTGAEQKFHKTRAVKAQPMMVENAKQHSATAEKMEAQLP